jgi:membrane associated rhomboid family serine protease
MKTSTPEKQEFIRAVYYPVLLLVTLWAIKGLELFGNVNFTFLGIYPLTLKGIPGILFSPLIHADFKHLFNNSIPLTILGTALFYFYRPVAAKIYILIWITTGFCVWIGGRFAYHIGASGVIYGLASFLFFSGVLRKNTKLLAISLLVIFLYGSLVWGIFPLNEEISWESHLFGSLSGLAFSFVYSKNIIVSENIIEPEATPEEEYEYPYWENDNTDDNNDNNIELKERNNVN